MRIMDVNIGEMNSTVRATDTQSLLSPQLLNQIVKAVLERMRAEQERERRIADERSIRSNALVSKGEDW
jgi:hypothetical protein